MAEWIESYRGVVSAWECDIVEHFTIAYYFDRFADATRNFVELIGLDDELRGHVQTSPARLFTTFAHELRAGAAFHIVSAVTGVEPAALSIGHQVIESTGGKTVTWLAESMPLPASLAPAARRKLEGLVTAWPGPQTPTVPPAVVPTGAITARDRVKPWEISEAGTLALPDIVHRLSGAGMQFLTSIGMTGAFMLDNRRGFSTFLLDLQLASAARSGERVDVRTTPVHLGNTSLRYVHHMTSADGRAIASMAQAGVLLDLDARRPTALPEAIRAAVASRLGNA